MRKEYLAALVFGLGTTMVVPTFAQQRASSSRRAQPRATASQTATPSATSDANAPANFTQQVGEPARGMGEGTRGARRGGANGFALMMLQMQARETAKVENDKVDVKKFSATFMEAVKAADLNSDGILSVDELQKIMEAARPTGFGGPNAPTPNVREASKNTTSFDAKTNSTTILRAQDNPTSRAFGPGVPSPAGFIAVITESSLEDGSIDIKKLEANLTKELTSADKDSDGLLDVTEWQAFSGMTGMMGGPNMGSRMRSMGIIMLQRQVMSAAQTDDGKIDIAKFRSEYISLLKEADANKDNILDSQELHGLQEKARESMGGPQGGFGGMPGGPGMGMMMGRGGSPFEAFKNADGQIDLAKIDSNLPFYQIIKAADKNNDNLLDDSEQADLQEQIRNQFGNRGGRQGGMGGPGMGGRDNFNGNGSSTAPTMNRRRGAFDSTTLNPNVTVRAQEENANIGGMPGGPQGGFGGMPGGPQGGFGGMPGGPQGGFGGMPGGPQGGFGGMPGGPQGGFGGMPGGPRGNRPNGMGGPQGGFGGGTSIVQKAATKASKEDDAFDITVFDAELTTLLNQADNEDDGYLDQMEQEDAFGRAMTFDRRDVRPEDSNERRSNSDHPDGPGASRENGRPIPSGSPNGPQARPNANDDRMQAMRVPTPDDSFVGVVANNSFKFAKARKEGDSAEKSPIETDYAIGKYEVRNREYKEFIDATSHEAPKYWTDGIYPKGTKNSPVVSVSLKDAEAYCEWLSSKYEGWTFRLPTEAEFENAASGTKKQRYPWGTASGFTYAKGKLTANCQYNATVVADLLQDETQVTIGNKKLNLADVVTISSKGVVSKGWRDVKDKSGFTYSDIFANQIKLGGFVVPVYKFRNNQSPYGCIGMSGNAAEWTTSVVDGKNVVRGGSWYSSADECAATYRGDLKDPTKGDPTIGFRVVAERIE